LPLQAKPILCYVTERQALRAAPGEDALHALLRRVSLVEAAGVDWIQLREKDLDARPLLELTCTAVKSAPVTRIFINDRLDVALAARAAGVHLGGESLPVAKVAQWKKERRAPADFLIGASCHSLEDARAAERDRADYVFFGPVFSTPSKLQYGPPQGLACLAEVCRAVRIPVLAIGGITFENAESCLDSGAVGLAAIRLFQEPRDQSALHTVVAALRR
jgi:thiamine-phosphate pyrophosphorylase